MTTTDPMPTLGTARAAAPAVRSMRAMASGITLRVEQPGRHAASCLDRAEAVFREVERTCSRFDKTSALSLANAQPQWWHDVPATLATAIQEAARAHLETDGLFDPRIHDTLVAWGYDRSLPFADGEVVRDGSDLRAIAPPREPDLPTPRSRIDVPAGATTWLPQAITREGRCRVNLGGSRIDLGGIGKGLAVRWAAAELAGAGAGYLVDAGGDGAFGGIGPEGGGWRVGVEDPAGGTEPVLVLELFNTGCATSSIRLRHWLADGKPVHHLIDPRTGQPGGKGLAAVTVAAQDAAWSEVWSKTLFLDGADSIRERADLLGLAVAWVRLDGTVGTSAAMEPLVIWRRTHG
ncbi:MAG: FAD:protein FMN transferase [Cellulomonas sp.]